MNVDSWKYHQKVPRDRAGNIEFRRWMRDRARDDRDARHQFLLACKRDMLFWLNTCCWVYEPRSDEKRETARKLPFVSWAFQDDALRDIVAAIGSHDLAIEKSRDMGVTWMTEAAPLWVAQFHHDYSFLVVSRKEELVDKPDDPKTLFWKLDFLWRTQPFWVRGERVRKEMHMHFVDTDSTIDGESTTADSARGDRRTAIIADEFASFPQGGWGFLESSRDATRSRIFVSTPKGSANAFYKVTHDPDVKKLTLHWRLHPLKNDGLYFVKGKPRSPWYDEQCRRAGHPMEIAQELDIDYIGSDYRFFQQDVLQEVAKRDVRDAVMVGELEYDPETLEPVEFRELEKGRLRLWCQIGSDGKPLVRRGYAMGGDVATGTGASNSTLCVGCREAREQVAEFASSEMLPHDFARYSVALARWFHEAEMIWEANGPGRIYGNTVWEAGYRHIYYRKDERKKFGNEASNFPGWFSTAEGKLSLLGELSRAMRDSAFLVRSYELVREATDYVYLPNGSVAHVQQARALDPSGARSNHGDRVLAAGLCWHRIRAPAEARPVKRTVEVGSLAWRRELAEQQERRHAYW